MVYEAGVPLAQRSERRSYVPKVAGSSPAWDKIHFLYCLPNVIASMGPAKGLRTPGIEPGAQAWEACMLPLHYERRRKKDA